MLFKILSFVKRIVCNLNSVSFVRLGLEKVIIIKVPDEFWVDGTDEKIGLRELMNKNFIITSCFFYHYTRFTFNRVD